MYLSLTAFLLSVVALGVAAAVLIRQHDDYVAMLDDLHRMRDDWKRAGQRLEEMRRGR